MPDDSTRNHAAAESSTTAAKPIGTCWRCGGVLYHLLAHSCTTNAAPPPHATSDRVAMGVGVDPQFLRLLRGEITAAEWGDWAERQYGYDTQEAFDACKALGQHARWWFLHGAMVGIAVGILVLLAVQVIHG